MYHSILHLCYILLLHIICGPKSVSPIRSPALLRKCTWYLFFVIYILKVKCVCMQFRPIWHTCPIRKYYYCKKGGGGGADIQKLVHQVVVTFATTTCRMNTLR